MGKGKRADHYSRVLRLMKAFDVIDHSLLLQKLRANGISGAEHAWFHSYFTNRKQFVQCNRVNSNVDSCLNWEPHISQLIERVSPKIAFLNRLAGFLDLKILLRILQTTILPMQ